MNIPVSKINKLTYLEVVDKIIELNKHARDFWSDALGWAPIEAASIKIGLASFAVVFNEKME